MCGGTILELKETKRPKNKNNTEAGLTKKGHATTGRRLVSSLLWTSD